MTKSKFKKLAELNKAMDKEMLETISAAGNQNKSGIISVKQYNSLPPEVRNALIFATPMYEPVTNHEGKIVGYQNIYNIKP